MAAEIEFDTYLRSLSTHYAKWWQLYTLTDAQTKTQKEPSPFDFELMAQTMAKERNSNPDAPEGQDKEKIERFPVLEGIRKYVAEHRQVLLVGRPGSGKSTTLARLLLEEARAGQCIPVLVELRFWSGSILDRIQAFFQRHGLQLDRTQIEDLLFHRWLLLLMDGLNELPSETARLDVMKFRQDYPQVSMIFTTRDLSLGGDFGLERKLEMQPLTEVQMQAFVRSYVPEQAEVMLRQLKDRLREFGQTPLLLWMLCEVFQQSPNNQLPSNLAEVFRAFTKKYEIDSVRKHEVALLKGDVKPLSDRRLWKDALKALASAMMQGETPVDFRVAIHRDEAERELNKIFAKEMFPIRDILDDLLKYHLLQNRSSDQIEFRHQLLQEYYAAEALLEQLSKLDDEQLKQTYLNFLKWTEPLALMLALVEDQAQAERIVRVAIKVDWPLGARLAGKVNPLFQEKTVGYVNDAIAQENLPAWLQVELWRETSSDEVIPSLFKMIEDSSPNSSPFVRQRAAETLGKLVSKKEIPRLLQMIDNAPSDVRWSVAVALGETGSEEAISSLLKALGDPNEFVRSSAVEALGKLGSEKAILDLLKALGDPNEFVRSSAAEALGKLGSEKAISNLLEALKDSSSYVGQSAADALGELGSKKAILGLLQAFKDLKHNYLVQREIAEALGKLGSEAAVPFKAEIENLKYNPAKALGLVSEEKIPRLLKMIENAPYKNTKTANIAVDALGQLGSDAAVSGLLNMIDHSNDWVRDKVAETLGELGSDAAIPFLLSALESSKDPRNRMKKAKLLGNIAKKHPEVSASHLPHLLSLIPTAAGAEAHDAIRAIQANCKFYNYDLTQTTHSMKLFFSYAHKDEPLRDELAKHLSLLKRQNIITDWYDRDITAGTEWAQSIDDNLNTSQIILLLISSDFITSDYCFDKEMTRALELHNQGTARVIPIILRPCDWPSAPFGKLQALPKDARPVTQWSDQDEAFTNIAQGIRKAVTELQQRKNRSISTPPQTSSSQPGNVTMNFYGTVHGAAGTVQGDQNIQP